MNKAELVAKIAKDLDSTKADAARALESVLGNISKGMKKTPVQLVGFGTFKIVKRKARKGVNPSTGEKIKIPAKKVVTFKPSKNPKYN